MNIAVFGIGGVGGLIGAALARHHSDTYFYARGENLQAIRHSGIAIESFRFGNFTAFPKLATDDATEIGIVDVLFVASKGYNLAEVCGAALPMIGPDTAVIPLLNGVGLSEMMAAYLPPCLLADGLIRTHSYLKKPGAIVHETGGLVIIGMPDGRRPAVLDAVAGLLSAAGIPTTVSDDIGLDCWKKYISVCGNGVAMCWFDAPPGGVRQKPGYEDVLRAIWGELVGVAAARGAALPADTVDTCVDAFNKAGPDTITSLYRDLSSGKPAGQTELFHLVGRLLQFGKACGIPTPYHQAVYEKYA